MPSTVLIADDDRSLRTVLEQAVRMRGYDVQLAEDGDSLMRMVRQGVGKALITDVVMPVSAPNKHALDLIPEIRELRPELPVIVISAQSTLTTAVKANDAGAFEYLAKPFDLDRLLESLDKALASIGEAAAADEPAPQVLAHPFMIGQSPAMQQLYRSIARLVQLDLTVMIHGESGTGKELVARALHDMSGRSRKPFIAVNMAAIPKELAESELFGHEKGAFTGAMVRRMGTFEMARGGTVFLDEIGDMPLDTQSKLLRVLQQGEFTSVGGTQLIKADARIICATHHDLGELVRQGVFREDLYYRLNVVPLSVPPLRARNEDIPALVEFFVQKATDRGLARKTFDNDAIRALQHYQWPGNVRELENMVYRLSALVPEHTIGLAQMGEHFAAFSSADAKQDNECLEDTVREHIARYFAAHSGGLPPAGVYDRIMPLLERPVIIETLRATRGNQLKAAHLLGINRNTLRKKIQELGIAVSGK